jgi:hypothetical protein
MQTRVHLGGLFCVLAISSQALAQFLPNGGVNTTDPVLPPPGVYLAPYEVHATYTGADLAIVLTAVQHLPYKDLDPDYVDRDGPGPLPDDEHHDFDSDLYVTATCQDIAANGCSFHGLPNGIPLENVLLEGRVQTVAYAKGPSSTTGTFQTEMVGMDLHGFSGMVRIRESPTLPSLGQTRITDNMDGSYHIDSFFDVFTELSLDGGVNYNYVAALPTRVDLVPEPASYGLLTIGLIAFASFVRRQGSLCRKISVARLE